MRRLALLLFAAGAALRIWTLATWRPAFIGYYDTAAYVDAARGSLFRDAFRPAGYPLFLRLVHTLSDRVVTVTLLQHALGLGTAALLYLAVRRVSPRPWVALVPAGVILLDGLQILLEHALLSDALFAFLLAAALYATTRAGLRWATAAGALIVAAGLVRTVGLFAAPLLLVAAPRRMLASGAAGAVLLAAYFAAQGSAGLSQASGWGLYARVGQFADCARFTPPAGTAALCETTPPSERPGTDYYFWSPESPAQRAFGLPPRHDAAVGAFAHAVVRHQPGDYLVAVARDFARYILPEDDERPRAGQTQAEYLAQAHNPRELAFIEGWLRRYYRDVPAARPGPAGAYARFARVEGPAMLLLLALAAAAPFMVRSAPAARFAATGFVLLVVPVATQVYDARYAVAALGPLSAAAALTLGGRSPSPARRTLTARPARTAKTTSKRRSHASVGSRLSGYMG